MKTTFAITAVLAVPLLSGGAQAQSSQMDAQQACGDDAYTLCQEAIPDERRVEACLRKNFKQVSPQCRHFMANYGKRHRRSRDSFGDDRDTMNRFRP